MRSIPESLQPSMPRFETPSHAVVVWTVEDEMVLSAKVPDAETRVRIWVNHPTEPDKVIIGLG
jgi:hypothetical protein